MRKSRKEEYVCSVCGWKTSNHASIGGHMKIHTEKKKEERILLEGKVPCNICGHTFKSTHAVNIHKSYKHKDIRAQEVASSKSFVCGICGRGFKDSHALNVHKGRKHRGIGTVPFIAPSPPTYNEGLNAAEIAGVLLQKVVDRINEDANLNNQIFALKKQNDDLGCQVKKEKEGKERAERVHNECLEQYRRAGNGGGSFPTMESVVEALRRKHVGGKPL